MQLLMIAGKKNMNVIILDWDSFGDMTPIFLRRGYNVKKCPIVVKADEKKIKEEESLLKEMIANAFGTSKPDYVFSFNYYPFASNICQEAEVPYISWIYDSPFLAIYSYTVVNPVNRIFMFDYGVYQEFANNGIETVHYLPLGVDPISLEKKCGKPGENVPGEARYSQAYLNLPEGRTGLDADVAFVGSLYTEPWNRLYDKFSTVSPYTKGYLDAIIQAQKNVYGNNFLESLLTPEIIDDMQKAYPCDPNSKDVMTPAQVYSQFVLSRQVTSLERTEILRLLGEKFKNKKLRLYTIDKTVKIDGWKNIGSVEYFYEMPQVFRCSKINLNITLRSILTGIPLRAFDIMGAGGFLLTNYQAEYDEYFKAGEDYVYYEDYDDLMNKVEYYLSHHNERKDIAESGCIRVRTEHTLERRLDAMEETL